MLQENSELYFLAFIDDRDKSLVELVNKQAIKCYISNKRNKDKHGYIYVIKKLKKINI